MKRGKKNIILLLLILVATVNYTFAADSINFSILEVPFFQYNPIEGCEILQMSYASSVIQNEWTWHNPDKKKEVYQVDIVFTKYPFYKKDWITNYDTLLNQRIKSICHLDPSISPAKVKWNLIIQTNCKNETQAKGLFHGAVVWYKEEAPAETVKVPLGLQDNKQKSIASQNIEELMSGEYSFPDSSVFKVLERNSQWTNMLIVNDWTASMYQYGAQAVLWHNNNLNKHRIARLSFFNDGDNKIIKKTGKTGGIYFADPNNIKHVVEVMKKVQKGGDGGDSPENDIEALIKSIRKTKKFSEVILIADNNSAVKDISLLKELKVPVRIIVCGSSKGVAIRHDYLQIASATKGSVHTIEEDIWNLSDVQEGERVTIMDVDYQRTHGRIVKAKPKNLKAHL